MKCSFFALLCLLLICLPIKVQAQTSGEFVIKGQVIDSLSNETVPYATISTQVSDLEFKPFEHTL